MDLGGAFSAAMKAGSGLIDAEIKKQNDIEAEQRAADLKISVEERMSAIREAADTRAAERREAIRQSGRVADFQFDTNPENVKAKATAEASALETTAPVKARLERDAAKEKLLSESAPEMLAAKRKIAQAGHIESASSIAAANLSKFQLQQLQEASALQKEYQAAVDAGDDVAAAKIERKIAAGKQTNKKDAGDYLRAATNTMKLVEDAETPEEAKELRDMAKLMFRLAGVDPDKAKQVVAPVSQLPPGAKQIGTSGGKPVYQTPDGKKFIQQ